MKYVPRKNYFSVKKNGIEINFGYILTFKISYMYVLNTLSNMITAYLMNVIPDLESGCGPLFT